MSAKPGATRAALWVLLGLAVLGGLAAWWLATHKLVAEVVPLPRTGEARRNPLYALKVALERDEVRVHARRRLQLLRGEREPAVRLAARDTVVYYNDPRTLSDAERIALLDWVARGGHLVVRTPPDGLLGSAAPAALLSALRLRPLDDADAGCEEFSPASPERESAVADAEASDAPEASAMFCGARRFTLAGANPVHSWGDLKRGYVFARVAHGQGSVDVLADLEFLGNDALDRAGSQELARQLLQPNHRHGTVHLVYAAELPSLWLTLIVHSWMAWVPLLLALACWLWRRMQRFGPGLPAPAAERRSLLEHIVASGEHAYRYGYAHLLYEAVHQAFLARLRRRDPQAAALQGEPQLALLAGRFPEVPVAELRDALRAPFANDHAAFRSRIATLIRLRNRL